MAPAAGSEGRDDLASSGVGAVMRGAYYGSGTSGASGASGTGVGHSGRPAK